MTEQQALVRRCLDSFYNRCSKILPAVPDDMIAPDADMDSEWRKWRPLPSTVKQHELDELNCQLPAPLPTSFQDFLTTYLILDLDFGRYKLPSLPSNGPLNMVKWRLLNPKLWPAGFLEFAGTEDGDPVCFDFLADANDMDYPVYAVNHDVLTADQCSDRTSVSTVAEFVASNFLEFLVDLCMPEGVTRNHK